MLIKKEEKKITKDSAGSLLFYSRKFELVLLLWIVLLFVAVGWIGGYFLESRLAISEGFSIAVSVSVISISLIIIRFDFLWKAPIFLSLYATLLAIFTYIFVHIYQSFPLAFIWLTIDLLILTIIILSVSPVVFIGMYINDINADIKNGRTLDFKQILKYSFSSKGFRLLYSFAVFLIFAGTMIAQVLQRYSENAMAGVWMLFSWLFYSFITLSILVGSLLIVSKRVETSLASNLLFIFTAIILVLVETIYLSFLFSIFEKMA